MPPLSRAEFCHCNSERDNATALTSEIMPPLSGAGFCHRYRLQVSAIVIASGRSTGSRGAVPWGYKSRPTE